MLITYRRTGGGLLLLAAVLVAAGITVAFAVVLGIAVAAIGAVALLMRAVMPSSQRRQAASPATPWPRETIEATVVNPRGSSEEGDLLHLDRDKG